MREGLVESGGREKEGKWMRKGRATVGGQERGKLMS